MISEREWYKPSEGENVPLMLYNSLVDEKTVFIPAAGKGSKFITWYTCGPTVYDAAHMGHARNYVSFDIVRRVLEDYFGYDCLFIMNVTDVDDKIILRARRNYLLKQYKNENLNNIKKVIEDGNNAIVKMNEKQIVKVKEIEELIKDAKEEQNDKKNTGIKKVDELTSILEQEKLKLKKHQDASNDFEQIKNNKEITIDNILNICGDYISEILDKEKGASVTDHSIFRAHAAKYEKEFIEDMEQLGCRIPDAFTRVSEYMEEIVEYVKGIINTGFAYESNNSVYFDTQKFKECGHVYGKLKPWAVGSAALAAEGESNFTTTEKRHPSDFALWKASKPGEPFWQSPWGHGRPGWHIECSAMASSITGSKLDIHSGGEDLKFPHHDNELAQAEAFYHQEGCRQWVNYFLHSGHLSIEGLKMSKSLKNFITIREALKQFTPRQLRMMFVLQKWNKPMVYGEQIKEEVKSKESMIKNFFQNIEVNIRNIDIGTSKMRWKKEELELQKQYQSIQETVHKSLCDDIDTKSAMDAICAIIKNVNIYLSTKTSKNEISHPYLLKRIAGYVSKILSVFGLIDSPSDMLSFMDTHINSKSSDIASYLDAFASFRDNVRNLSKDKADHKMILDVCDEIRDKTMVSLGIRLEDQADGKSIWKLEDPEILKKEIEEKRNAANESLKKKLKNKLELKIKEKERFEKALAPPEKYSRFDSESGYPTHDANGQELEGKAKDNAKKDYEKILKKKAPYEKKLKEIPNYLDDLDNEISDIKNQISVIESTI